MQQESKVSILIPAKNEVLFVEECLISIQKQSYKNWEVILVDDHSTDATASIVKGFAKEDERFQYVSNKGRGIIEALQTAYDLSQGDFITRMDADDIMRPNKIKVLLSGLLKYGNGHVAVGGVHYFSETNLKSGFKNYQEWLNQHTQKGTNFTDIFKECVIPSPCWMLFREDLDRIGAFNEKRYPEDYDLAFRMYSKGYKVIPTNEILHEWRDYDTRTSRISENYKEYTFTAMKWDYFDLLHRNLDKGIVIVGTGYRGKKIAEYLLDLKIEFTWVSNNQEKIGKHIYDQMIFDLSVDLKWKKMQFICAIANKTGKNFIEQFFLDRGGDIKKDLFHFC